jgi:CheY-like chemotaxis protein
VTRILVVDDDDILRSIVSDALRLDGYVVDSVANGHQALLAFTREQPDVMVLDLTMPLMDGPALVHTLRDQERLSRVPFVVVSADEDARAQSARLGARACVVKPFDLAELLLTIQAIAPL